MAAPFAYEQPTLNKSWQAFVSNLATLAVVWLVAVAISVLGALIAFLIVQLFTLLASTSSTDAAAGVIGIGSLFSNLAQFPFSIASSLVSILLTAVPAIYYETGRNLSIREAFSTLLRRPLRYFLAGLLFTVAFAIGFVLCVLPGIAVLLVMPVYVNRIFNTDDSITDALSRSFQAVYKSEHGFTFIGIQLLVGLCVLVFTFCTCFIGGLVAFPVGTFYIQNAAYRQGVIS